MSRNLKPYYRKRKGSTLKKIAGYFVNHAGRILKFSIILNMVTAVIKFYFGISIPSYLFGFNAGYYIVLCVARVFLLNKIEKLNKSFELSKKERTNIEVKVYGHIGIFHVLMGAMYFASSTQLYNADENVVYSGYLVYYAALVAFTKLIIAIHGKVIYKRLHKPILAALKQISFSDALVSIVVTECTLLAMKGNLQANVWSSYSGILVGVVIFIQGIMMVLKARRYSYCNLQEMISHEGIE